MVGIPITTPDPLSGPKMTRVDRFRVQFNASVDQTEEAPTLRTSRNAVSMSPYRGQRRAENDEHAGAMRRCDRIKEPLHDDHVAGPNDPTKPIR